MAMDGYIQDINAIQATFTYTDLHRQEQVATQGGDEVICITDHFAPPERWGRRRRPGGFPANLEWPRDILTPTLDPLLRCESCQAQTICDCSVTGWRRRRAFPTRLFETRNRGICVRVLNRPRRSGAILGDYVGLVVPYDAQARRSDYGFSLDRGVPAPGQPENPQVIGVIDSEQAGNWTRFLAHSCRPNLEFEERRVGRTRIIALVVVRNVWAYNELTVFYHDRYFEGNNWCHCGESVCTNPPPVETNAS